MGAALKAKKEIQFLNDLAGHEDLVGQGVENRLSALRCMEVNQHTGV